MSNNPPPFRPWAIYVTTIVTIIVVIGFSWYGLSHAGNAPYEFLFPTLIFVWLIGAKLAAPKLPWMQVVLAGTVIIIVHFGIEAFHFVPANFIGEKIIQAICVLGFGAYWVRRNYIPSSANYWPE